jgi:LTXXQ motif family protein
MKRMILAMVALVTVGLLATITPSSAQQPGMGMREMPMGRGMMGMMGDCPMMGMMMGADTSTFAEGRIAFLKAELAISDAQKAVWEAYAAALKKNLQAMQAMRQTMMKVMEAKTPTERLDAHIAAMDGRLASLKEVKPALAALYAALSDEQKKKADQILTGMGCMM